MQACVLLASAETSPRCQTVRRFLSRAPRPGALPRHLQSSLVCCQRLSPAPVCVVSLSPHTCPHSWILNNLSKVTVAELWVNKGWFQSTRFLSSLSASGSSECCPSALSQLSRFCHSTLPARTVPSGHTPLLSSPPLPSQVVGASDSQNSGELTSSR